MFYYFSGFPRSKILWVVDKKTFQWKINKDVEHFTKSLISFSNLPFKLAMFPIIFQLFIKRTLRYVLYWLEYLYVGICEHWPHAIDCRNL